MEIHLNIIGWLFIALAGVHAIFPRYFHWKKELATLSLINKQMMEIHTFFIALMVLLMGLLCVTSAEELVQTTLGRKVSLGFAIFWLARLLIQFFGYSSKLWRGKRFETTVHVVFACFWTYVSWAFLAVYWA